MQWGFCTNDNLEPVKLNASFVQALHKNVKTLSFYHTPPQKKPCLFSDIWVINVKKTRKYSHLTFCKVLSCISLHDQDAGLVMNSKSAPKVL